MRRKFNKRFIWTPQIALFFACAAVAAMADKAPHGYNNHHEEESYGPAKYEFDWQVDEDYNKFGQEEQRDGYNTQGSYYVNLPDGRTQKVNISQKFCLHFFIFKFIHEITMNI